MEYRTLSRNEINKLEQLDRTEKIENNYLLREGKLVLVQVGFNTQDWSKESKQKRIANLQAVFDKGATFYGAFDSDSLAGMSVLDHNPVQTGVARLNLEGLWVSHGYRGKGVGKTLFQMAAQAARSRGANLMYVSSTPSENTVHFYQRLGCQLANPVDPTLFAKEPEDIHLELVL